MTIADGGDGFGTFLDRVDGRVVDRFVSDKMSPHFLADKVEYVVAHLRRRALQRSDQALNRIGLRAGEDSIDLSCADAQRAGKALDPGTVHQRGKMSLGFSRLGHLFVRGGHVEPWISHRIIGEQGDYGDYSISSSNDGAATNVVPCEEDSCPDPSHVCPGEGGLTRPEAGRYSAAIPA